MKISYFYLTKEGEKLANLLASSQPGTIYGKENFKQNMKKAFEQSDALICIMATGIVVRTLAPLIEHKTKDPAVIVMDQNGTFAISLLSGHLGGANELAHQMAKISGGMPVITTATDVAGKLSFDVFAKKNDLAIQNIETLKWISNAVVDGKRVDVITNKNVDAILNDQICLANNVTDAPAVVIDEKRTIETKQPVLYLRPRTICVGVGCTRNRSKEEISLALKTVLKREGIHPLSIKSIATIPLKQDEPGIIALAKEYKVPLVIVPKEEIEALNLDELGIKQSDFVRTQTGVMSVSTACAFLSSDKGTILLDKEKFPGVTIAIAQKHRNNLA